MNGCWNVRGIKASVDGVVVGGGGRRRAAQRMRGARGRDGFLTLGRNATPASATADSDSDHTEYEDDKDDDEMINMAETHA